MKKSENQKEIWPDAPEHLSEKAKYLFVFYVGKTVRSPGQIALFIQGLESMDQADECARIIRKDGLSQKSERSKMTRQNPLLNTQRQATAEMLKVWKLLGLNMNRQPSKSGWGYENIS